MPRTRVPYYLTPLLLSSGVLFAQTTLTLASGSANAGGSAALNLNLNTAAGNQPAGLEWTISYPTSSIASLNVSVGAAATAAGKTLTCSPKSGSTTCLVSGMNATAMNSGVVAIVNLTLSSGASGTVTVSLGNVIGVRADGSAASVTGTGGTVGGGGGGTSPSGTATYVKTDFVTSGSWKGIYGAEGSDIVGDSSGVPSYVTVTPSASSPYVWATSTSDLRALQKASSPVDRVAAAWYSTSSFTVDLNFKDSNTHQVAIYMLDWDANNARSQRVDVLDGNNTVLDTRTADDFKTGQYLVWKLSGHVILRFTNLGANNALVNGIFFGNSPATVTSAAAAYVQADNTTKGSWKGVYGADGSNVIGDSTSYPAYVTATPSGNASYVWAASSTDPRALTKTASATDRVAGVWYAPTSFTLDLNFKDSNMHRVAFYLLDFDSNNTRTERIDILDANNNLLDTRTASGFSNGLYLVWSLSSHVTVRFTNAGGANAVLSGIFFGAGPSPVNATATFLRTDTTTSGTWKGVYGADGYALAGDAVKLPTTITVTTPPTSAWVWAASTSDKRALQQAGSPTSRVAACAYSPTALSMDLNFSDGNVHQIALYLLDWDGNNHRSERVDILDANNNVIGSQTASGFSGGQYLVWNVSGHVVVRVTNTSSPNAVLSGVFFR